MSLKSKIEKFDPGCVFIQETKLYKKGQVKFEGYEAFEQVRKSRSGGGLLLMVRKSFDPVLIHEGDEDNEILVVQGKVGKLNIRFINAYGPQEDDPSDHIMGFYEKLEEQIVLAIDDGCGIIIECDANAKLGDKIIQNDPNSQSNNGDLLWSLVNRNNLTVLNSLDICCGTITRHRVTKCSEEKAVLDYFIVCDKMLKHVTKMDIDEQRTDVLTKYAGRSGNPKLVPSDHNLLVSHFNIEYKKELISSRVEIFDFKNSECQKKFLVETSKNKLSNCFRDGCDVEENCRRFEKTFNKIVHKCFKKVRIRKKKGEAVTEQIKRLSNLRAQSGDVETINNLEKEIQEQCAAENARIIREQVEMLSDTSGNFSSNLMWKVKSKVCKKAGDPPMAKKDSRGNLVTAPTQLKNLYSDEYVHRLRHREIKDSLETLKSLKEDVWSSTFRILCSIESPDWTNEDVEKVLSKMSRNKSRDPLGYVNELFLPGVCGPDLVKAITMLANSCKNQTYTPNFLKLTNITTIYKNKGSRFDLINDRGIFNMVIFRKIIDRLIYNDVYDNIDKNMSCSNVGGRKGRNIRNHLFIVYGIINSVVNNESPPVDLQFYDLKQCFDAMWLEESMNDLCSTIPRNEWNNKLALIYQNNSENKVAIRTPFGLTERVSINKIVTQGGVWGPIQCSNQVDKLGKECVNRNIHLFKYKDSVRIMPLAMIDDILAIAPCGFKSFALNTFINCKMEMKKLIFSDTKCKQIHVGKEGIHCPSLEVHGRNIDKSSCEKYLGDLIAESTNKCNECNISNRAKKGIGLVAQIMSLLDNVSLGQHYYLIAMLLRESIFINGILFNSEVWYSPNKKQISELEYVDKLLLRRILQAPVSTPGEALYLETGAIPISIILKKRRLMFLHYLLNLDENEMLHKFFHAQWVNPNSNDWTLSIREVLNEFEIRIDLSYIKSMSTGQLKNIVNKKATEIAFHNMLNSKETHKKMSDIRYSNLGIQPYLTDSRITNKDAKLLFLFRTKMVRVGMNYRGGHDVLSCPLCNSSADTQKHLLVCPRIHSSPPDVHYEDIFGCDITLMSNTLQLLKEALRKRVTMLSSEES